jgi:hypothetical protein
MASDLHRTMIPKKCHPTTRAIYQYWLTKAGTRSMPARKDIDPTGIPRNLLPGLSLVEVVSDERRYVYRLVGTDDVQVRGQDPTGKAVSEGYFGPSLVHVLASYDQVVASRLPFYDPTHFRAPNGRYVTEETLFLPLSDDGTNVNKILVFSQSRDVQTSVGQGLHPFSSALTEGR